MTDHCTNCGCVLEPASKGKSRSLPQHARFFGVISTAYDQWPEANEFQPESVDHLRAYLICKAGYRDSTDIAAPYAEDEPGLTRLIALSIEAAIVAAGGFAFVRHHPDGGVVRVYKAKSLKFKSMGHQEFCALSNAVDDVLRAEGLDPDVLAKERECAA